MLTPIGMASSAVFLLLALILLTILLKRNQGLMINICFPLAAAASFLAFLSGVQSVAAGTTEKIILVLGLPDLPFHLRLDPLSGFFLTVIGLLSFFVSVYSIGYVRGFLGKTTGDKSAGILLPFYRRHDSWW